jgi:hypothetical protein
VNHALPHESVHVRLGLSRIDGIGVFAIRAIPAGTNLFGNDEVRLVWVDSAALERAGLSEEERRLYADFGIRRGDRIGCPVNFNNLTPGWYLNEPPDGEAPSVRVDDALNFYAARDIEEGEELTVRYTDFSEAPEDGEP